MAVLKGKAVIGQSGGPTMVINQSLVGAVEEALKHDEIEAIYGARHGVTGIMAENFVDLGKESRETLELVARTPSAALGTVRWKPNDEDCRRIFEVFRKYNVRYFFYIGGGDSAEAADIINRMAQKADYEFRVFHIPKTIDNDLKITDHCPGYGSAAKYVATVFMGEELENRAFPGIKIDVVMGRHAGWLTAASMLGRKGEQDGPHLVYVPETVFDKDQFLADVHSEYEARGRLLVAVSEGIHDASGEPIGATKETDAFGWRQLSGTGFLGDFLGETVKGYFQEKDGRKVRVRCDTLGYPQRSYPDAVSEVDAREARMVGQAAVREAVSGDVDGSIGIRRTGDGANYASEPFLMDLHEIAGDVKTLPQDYISKGNNNIAETFKDYALPLVGGLPEVGSLRGFPLERLG